MMLKTMTAVRQPDLSLPVGLKGVEAKDVIIPLPTAEELREARMKLHHKTIKQQEEYEASIVRSLEKSLSLCEVKTA